MYRQVVYLNVGIVSLASAMLPENAPVIPITSYRTMFVVLFVGIVRMAFVKLLENAFAIPDIFGPLSMIYVNLSVIRNANMANAYHPMSVNVTKAINSPKTLHVHQSAIQTVKMATVLLPGNVLVMMVTIRMIVVNVYQHVCRNV